MGELLQYRFPGEERAQGLGGHAFGNLLIAALTAVEGGDFEEGVRQMNRVLAVRGQVVPVSPTPLVLHAELADGTELDGQSAIMRRPAGSSGSGCTPRGVRRDRGRHGRDRRGGSHRDRPGQPVHEPPAEPPGARDPGCGRRLERRRGSTSATWPPSPARRRVRPGRPCRGARARTPRAGIVDIVLANNRTTSGGSAERGAPVGDAIRLRWPPNVEPRRGSSSTILSIRTNAASSRPRTSWPRPSCGSPSATARSTAGRRGRPQRVTAARSGPGIRRVR